MGIARFLLILGALASLSACARRAPVVVTVPTAYRASQGFALYQGEAYSWINTACGPIELDHAWVTSGVMTDEGLTSDCSDIAGLCIGGKAWIRDSVIRGNSRIGCDAYLYDSEVFGTLGVGQDLHAERTTFHEDVTVCGNVTAKCVCFESDLEATASVICLSNTSTGTINVQPVGPYYEKQIVRLCRDSVVDGDIYFVSGRGRVVMDTSSSITGKIYGGHVIEQFECYKQPFYEALED